MSQKFLPPPPRCLKNAYGRQETNKQISLLLVNFIVVEKKGYCANQSRQPIQITYYFLNDTNQLMLFPKQCFAVSITQKLVLPFLRVVESPWEGVNGVSSQSTMTSKLLGMTRNLKGCYKYTKPGISMFLWPPVKGDAERQAHGQIDNSLVVSNLEN